MRLDRRLRGQLAQSLPDDELTLVRRRLLVGGLGPRLDGRRQDRRAPRQDLLDVGEDADVAADGGLLCRPHVAQGHVLRPDDPQAPGVVLRNGTRQLIGSWGGARTHDAHT